MAQKEIGKVNHWYDKAQVAVVKLSGSLKVGDKIKTTRYAHKTKIRLNISFLL